MTEVNPLLNGTLAGKIAQKLDAADGSKDGKINASIWNEFVADKGGKTIKESIDVVSAMNSITTYVVRNAAKAGKAVDELAKEWLGIEISKGTAGTEETGAAQTPTTPEPPTESPEETAVQEASTVNKEQAAKDAESVKVTVPSPKRTVQKPKNKAEVDSIIKNQKEGREVANKIRNALNSLTPPFSPGDVDKAEETLKLITKDNVVYVLEAFPDIVDCIDGVNALGYGFDKDEVIKYVLTPLGQKGDEYGWGSGKGENRITLSQYYKENAGSWSLDKIKENINEYCKNFTSKERDKVKTYNEQMTQYNKETTKINDFNKNKKPKAQKTFDDANKFLAEVANMEPKPEVIGDKDWKHVALPDGRWIQVYYDENGEICDIYISHDTTPDIEEGGSTYDGFDVIYTSEKAECNYDHCNSSFEGIITSGYDFEKLKALTEKIFG